MEKISCYLNRIIMAFSFLLFPIVSSFAQNNELTGYLSDLPFGMPAMTVPVFPERSVNIMDFGAVGDGQTLNTEAFANAIDHCASLGGGTVIVPPGLWLTGPVLFRSNINLHLEKGALVLFSCNHHDYPVMKNPVNGSFTVRPPISGYELENIAITGEGILDGSGDTWRPVKKSKTTEEQWKKLLASGGTVDSNDIWWPTREAREGELYINDLKKKNNKNLAEKDFEPARDFLRPYMLVFYKCKKVLLDGPTFQNSPKFVLYPTFCEDMVIRNIKVLNEWWAQNGDGIDINGGKNILVYNCMVNAGDDGICMKSSKSRNYDSDPVLQNVVISGCTVYHAHGGFVIGSNIDGGIRNISVKNCDFISTDIGLRFKSSRGKGGLVENIFVNNIFMKDIANEAILFDTYYEIKNLAEQEKVVEVNETTPRFRKFYIRNIYCNGAEQAVKI
ncbi:MAG: glycoside hydrolase family 28 protein, partial [Bacteroidota bacterium]|nr:glycoside hydrolase family 28 protein [Bacteroidota bacterium]